MLFAHGVVAFPIRYYKPNPWSERQAVTGSKVGSDDDTVGRIVTGWFDSFEPGCELEILSGPVSNLVVVDGFGPVGDRLIESLPPTPMVVDIAVGVLRFYRYPSKGRVATGFQGLHVGSDSARVFIHGDCGGVRIPWWADEAVLDCLVSPEALPLFDIAWFGEEVVAKGIRYRCPSETRRSRGRSR